MVLVKIATLFLLMAAACDLSPLRDDDLFESTRVVVADAAAADVAQPDVAQPDTQAPTCQSASRTGILSGIAVDKCTGAAVNVLVGIFGRHQCSFAGKGSLCFNNLPVHCDLTLTAGHPGYKPFFRTINIPPEGSASVKIELERAVGTCADPPPPNAGSCACNTSMTCVSGCNN